MRVCVCVISNTNLTRFAAVPVELGLKHPVRWPPIFPKNIGIFAWAFLALVSHWFHTPSVHRRFVGDSHPLRDACPSQHWSFGVLGRSRGRCDLFWSRRGGRSRDGTRDARPRTDRAPTLGLVDVATLRRWPSSPLPSSRASTRSWRPAWRAGAGALRWRNVSSARAPPPRAQALTCKRAVPKKKTMTD